MTPVHANRACKIFSFHHGGSYTRGLVLLGTGGTHHAFADRGEGFCVFNDIAVSARMAMAEEGIERVLVIDLDVHQVWQNL